MYFLAFPSERLNKKGNSGGFFGCFSWKLGKLTKRGIKGVIRPRKSMDIDRGQEEIEKEERRIELVKDGSKREEIGNRLLRLRNLREYFEDEKKWKEQNWYTQRWKAEGRFSVFKRLFGEYGDCPEFS